MGRLLALLLVVTGCMPSLEEKAANPPPLPDDAYSTGGEARHSPSAPAPPASAAAPAPSQRIAEAPPLPARVDAGKLPRAGLMALLERGVPHFLQRVQVEPDLRRGRFTGWRLVSIFAGDAAMNAGVLRVGDTVMRVNGQSIERPEQFKNVWDSLATSSEIVFEVRRGDQPSTVRYEIVDPPAP